MYVNTVSTFGLSSSAHLQTSMVFRLDVLCCCPPNYDLLSAKLRLAAQVSEHPMQVAGSHLLVHQEKFKEYGVPWHVHSQSLVELLVLMVHLRTNRPLHQEECLVGKVIGKEPTLRIVILDHVKVAGFGPRKYTLGLGKLILGFGTWFIEAWHG